MRYPKDEISTEVLQIWSHGRCFENNRFPCTLNCSSSFTSLHRCEYFRVKAIGFNPPQLCQLQKFDHGQDLNHKHPPR